MICNTFIIVGQQILAADDINLLKDAINVGENTLLNFISAHMDKVEHDKEKTIHLLQASKRKMETLKMKKAKNSGGTALFSGQQQEQINETSNVEDGKYFKEKPHEVKFNSGEGSFVGSHSKCNACLLYTSPSPRDS